MKKDTRVLEKVLELKRRLEDDWTDDLEKLNLWPDLEDFYLDIMRKDDRRVANTIFTFIVLCYDASSEYLETTIDRINNKKSVMARLAGPSWAVREIYVDTVLGDSDQGHRGIIDKTIEWYIERQKDWRWNEIVSAMEFHAKALVLSQGAISIKEMRDAGAMKREATDLREKADAYLDAIRKEFVEVDTAVEKEGRQKLTDRLNNDHNSWELFILKKNNKEASLKDNEAASMAFAMAVKEHNDDEDDDGPI